MYIVLALTRHILNLIQNLSHPSLTLGLRDQFPSYYDHLLHHQHLSNQIMSLSCHLLLKKGQRKFSFVAKKFKLNIKKNFVLFIFFDQLPLISGFTYDKDIA